MASLDLLTLAAADDARDLDHEFGQANIALPDELLNVIAATDDPTPLKWYLVLCGRSPGVYQDA